MSHNGNIITDLGILGNKQAWLFAGSSKKLLVLPNFYDKTNVFHSCAIKIWYMELKNVCTLLYILNIHHHHNNLGYDMFCLIVSEM